MSEISSERVGLCVFTAMTLTHVVGHSLKCSSILQDDNDTEGVGDSVNSSTSSLPTSRPQKISYLKRKAAANREVQENSLTMTLDGVRVSGLFVGNPTDLFLK